MDDEPGRLVHHEEVVVLVGDPELDRRCGRGDGSRCEIDGHLLPAFEAVALGLVGPVDEHLACRQQPLRGCT